MPSGTTRGFLGNYAPLEGESEFTQLNTANDIITLTMLAGSVAKALNVRYGVTGASVFSIGPNGLALGGFTVKPVTKTVNYTVVVADSGSFFNNLGAAGAVNFTLPAVAGNSGFVAVFSAAVAAQNLVITAPAGTLVTFNNIAATSITISTASRIAGAAVMVVCDGVKYYAYDFPSIGTIATAGINDFTVA